MSSRSRPIDDRKSTVGKTDAPPRRMKRKCSRDLPSCSLVRILTRPLRQPASVTPIYSQRRQCVRLQRVCEYGPENISSATSANGKPAILPSPPSPERKETYHNAAFPTSFFLDQEYFQPLPRHALTMSQTPSFISQAAFLLAGDDLQALIDNYTSTIHTWLPMLSIKRLRQEADALKADEQSITAMLFLSIKALMARHVPWSTCDTAEENGAYLAARQYSFMAESGGFINMRLVQALALIATYELGHGIYPAAYLTIGRAVRLGTMIGLQRPRHAKQLFVDADTWTQCEEQRRTWWTILMLDRAVVVGSPGLLMAAPDPGPDDLLPSQDADWTAGKIGSNDALLTHDFHSPSLGGFARVCQAVHVLGKVIRHVHARKHALDIVALIQEALQLHKILESLDASLDVEGEPDTVGDYSALSLCCLARLILYNQYACNEPTAAIARGRIALEVEMQQLSLEGIKEISPRTVPDMARDIISASQQGLCGSRSPIVAACMYLVATECAWFLREDGDAEMAAGLESIKVALEVMSFEWGVCGEYLGLLQRNGLG